MNKFFLLLVLLFFTISSSFGNFDEVDGSSYLYVTKAEEIDSLESITYLFGIEGADAEYAMDFFTRYSKTLGESHGGTIIPSFSYLASIQKTEREYKKSGFGVSLEDVLEFEDLEILAIRNKSSCDFIRGARENRSYIIHENLKTKKCMYLNIGYNFDFIELLSIVNKVRSDAVSMKEAELMSNMENDLTLIIPEVGGKELVGLKNELRQFLRVLVEFVSN